MQLQRVADSHGPARCRWRLALDFEDFQRISDIITSFGSNAGFLAQTVLKLVPFGSGLAFEQAEWGSWREGWVILNFECLILNGKMSR
jgi:hypothetical protein